MRITHGSRDTFPCPANRCFRLSTYVLHASTTLSSHPHPRPLSHRVNATLVFWKRRQTKSFRSPRAKLFHRPSPIFRPLFFKITDLRSRSTHFPVLFPRPVDEIFPEFFGTKPTCFVCSFFFFFSFITSRREVRGESCYYCPVRGLSSRLCDYFRFLTFSRTGKICKQ